MISSHFFAWICERTCHLKSDEKSCLLLSFGPLPCHTCLQQLISNARIDSTSRSLWSPFSPVSLDTFILTPALLPNAQPYIFLLAGHRFLVSPTQGEGVPGVATAVWKTRPCGGWHCFWTCVGILPHSYIQKLQKRRRHF